MNNCFSIVKGHIQETSANGQLAKVEYLNKVYDNVNLVYPYGFSSSIQGKSNPSSMCLIYRIMDSDTILYATPYRYDTQPLLLENEVAIGNFVGGGMVVFKADGSLDITSPTNITATIAGKIALTVTGTVTVSATSVILGDGTAPVLNNNTTITAPSGGGTCSIDNSGQTKVLA